MDVGVAVVVGGVRRWGLGVLQRGVLVALVVLIVWVVVFSRVGQA